MQHCRMCEESLMFCWWLCLLGYCHPWQLNACLRLLRDCARSQLGFTIGLGHLNCIEVHGTICFNFHFVHVVRPPFVGDLNRVQVNICTLVDMALQDQMCTQAYFGARNEADGLMMIMMICTSLLDKKWPCCGLSVSQILQRCEAILPWLDLHFPCPFLWLREMMCLCLLDGQKPLWMV